MRRAHQRRAARAGAARPRRSLRRDRASRSTCSTSSIRWCPRRCASSAPASARCWWSRKARPTTSSRRSTSSCAAPTSRPACSARAAAAAPANTPPTCCSTGLRRSSRETRPAGIDADAIARARAGDAGAQAGRGRRRSATCRRGRRTSAPAARSGRCSAAIKLMQRELGPTHISADIGCHSFATFAPFSLGNSILGYGMSLASAAAVGAQHGPPPDRDHGRRRLLAQRPDHRRRLQPVQQGRRRADRDAERLHLRHRPAIPAVERGQPQRRADRHGPSSRRCARSASNGCARCAPTASPRWPRR